MINKGINEASFPISDFTHLVKLKYTKKLKFSYAIYASYSKI